MKQKIESLMKIKKELMKNMKKNIMRNLYQIKCMNILKCLFIFRHISEAKNKSNIEKIQRRNVLYENLKTETLEKIKTFTNPNNQDYKNLLKKLILQGAIKLLEEVVLLKIRKSDKSYVESILEEIQKEYHSYLKKETEEDYNVKFEIDSNFLENE